MDFTWNERAQVIKWARAREPRELYFQQITNVGNNLSGVIKIFENEISQKSAPL